MSIKKLRCSLEVRAPTHQQPEAPSSVDVAALPAFVRPRDGRNTQPGENPGYAILTSSSRESPSAFICQQRGGDDHRAYGRQNGGNSTDGVDFIKYGFWRAKCGSFDGAAGSRTARKCKTFRLPALRFSHGMSRIIDVNVLPPYYIRVVARTRSRSFVRNGRVPRSRAWANARERKDDRGG